MTDTYTVHIGCWRLNRQDIALVSEDHMFYDSWRCTYRELQSVGDPTPNCCLTEHVLINVR